MKPYLIGIAGPSGAGKSFLAQRLAEELKHATILPIDAYYPDLSHLSLEQRAGLNFDDPAILDTALLFDQVARLANGDAIAQPVYDFEHHTRTRQTLPIAPTEFVIVEGLFTLHWPVLRGLLHTRVYVEVGDPLCLERRMARDVRDRGRTPEYVRHQFESSVVPMADLYVRPSVHFADVRVYGASPIDEEVKSVLSHVSGKG